jgi:hypothetical protein
MARPESFDDADAFSVEEFCWRHRISVQVFYKYPDLMPDSFYVGSRRLISREAAARWRAAREAEAAYDEAARARSKAAREAAARWRAAREARCKPDDAMA